MSPTLRCCCARICASRCCCCVRNGARLEALTLCDVLPMLAKLGRSGCTPMTDARFPTPARMPRLLVRTCTPEVSSGPDDDEIEFDNEPTECALLEIDTESEFESVFESEPGALSWPESDELMLLPLLVPTLFEVTVGVVGSLDASSVESAVCRSCKSAGSAAPAVASSSANARSSSSPCSMRWCSSLRGDAGRLEHRRALGGLLLAGEMTILPESSRMSRGDVCRDMTGDAMGDTAGDACSDKTFVGSGERATALRPSGMLCVRTSICDVGCFISPRDEPSTESRGDTSLELEADGPPLPRRTMAASDDEGDVSLVAINTHPCRAGSDVIIDAAYNVLHAGGVEDANAAASELGSFCGTPDEELVGGVSLLFETIKMLGNLSLSRCAHGRCSLMVIYISHQCLNQSSERPSLLLSLSPHISVSHWKPYRMYDRKVGPRRSRWNVRVGNVGGNAKGRLATQLHLGWNAGRYLWSSSACQCTTHTRTLSLSLASLGECELVPSPRNQCCGTRCCPR